jgi:hypothetical protein
MRWTFHAASGVYFDEQGGNLGGPALLSFASGAASDVCVVRTLQDKRYQRIRKVSLPTAFTLQTGSTIDRAF